MNPQHINLNDFPIRTVFEPEYSEQFNGHSARTAQVAVCHECGLPATAFIVESSGDEGHATADSPEGPDSTMVTIVSSTSRTAVFLCDDHARHPHRWDGSNYYTGSHPLIRAAHDYTYRDL